MQGTLRFLKKKGVVQKSHVVREPQPLEEGSRVSVPLHIFPYLPTPALSLLQGKMENWEVMHEKF